MIVHDIIDGFELHIIRLDDSYKSKCSVIFQRPKSLPNIVSTGSKN
jgi:hypothetical protein